MAEDPDARRGRFARSMMRAATMDNPPAAIHALAEAAQISAKSVLEHRLEFVADSLHRSFILFRCTDSA